MSERASFDPLKGAVSNEPVTGTRPPDVAPRAFDEQSLRQAIVNTWGPAGAHVDLFDTLLARLTAAEAERDRLRAAEALADIVVFLEDSQCGCDCGKFLHGNSSDAPGPMPRGCSYCERVAAWRALTHKGAYWDHWGYGYEGVDAPGGGPSGTEEGT